MIQRLRTLGLLATTPSVRPDFDGHPRHVFVSSVLGCERCMGTLMSQLDKRRALDALESGR